MVGGLLCLVRRQLTSRTIVAAALLMLAGGFTKHSLIALPLATTVWLFLRNRREFRIWVLTGTIGLVVCLGICEAVFGVGFFSSVFGYKREMTFGLLAAGISYLAPIAVIALFGSVPVFLPDRWRNTGGLLAISTLFATVWSIVMWSGRGIGWNANFDIVIYGVPSAIQTVEALRPAIAPKSTGRVITSAMWLVLAIPALTPISIRGPQLVYWMRDRQSEIAWSKRTIERLRNSPDPVACFRLALCYWAGKSFALDPFSASQAALKSPKINERLIETFEVQRFSAIQVNSDWKGNKSVMARAIADNYEAASPDSPYGNILMPKPRSDQ